jgi:hypothetical protein
LEQQAQENLLISCLKNLSLGHPESTQWQISSKWCVIKNGKNKLFLLGMTTLGKLLLSLVQILGTDVPKNHSCCRKEFKYKTSLLTDSPGKILFKKIRYKSAQKLSWWLVSPKQ